MSESSWGQGPWGQMPWGTFVAPPTGGTPLDISYRTVIHDPVIVKDALLVPFLSKKGSP